MYRALQNIAVLLAFGLLAVEGQSGEADLCRTADKCGECQSTSQNCTWCSDVNFSEPRCDHRENLEEASCHTITTVTESNIRIREGAVLSNTLFVYPQRVTASLFKRRPATFTVKVRVPQGYTRRRVTLRGKQPPAGLVVSISSQCQGFRGGGRSSCPVSGPDEEVEFQVRLMITACGDRYQTRMRFKALRIAGNVRVDIINRCICPCEFYSVLASSDSDEHCNDNGEVKCGLCHCYPGYAGDHCEFGSQQYDPRCKAPSDSRVCSGRGECISGQCRCNNLHHPANTSTRFTGQYCQCDDSSCPLFQGQLCGGPDRGRCSCGMCACRNGYIGQGCGTSTSIEACMASSGLICDGRGRCIDQQCHCEGKWSGPKCDDCMTCEGRCDDLLPCVQCVIFDTGPYNNDQCNQQCTALDITAVDNIEETNLGNAICTFRDEDSGMINFAYVYTDDGSMVVLVNRPQ